MLQVNFELFLRCVLCDAASAAATLPGEWRAMESITLVFDLQKKKPAKQKRKRVPANNNCPCRSSRTRVKILLVVDFPLSGLINETKVHLRYCFHPFGLADLVGR